MEASPFQRQVHALERRLRRGWAAAAPQPDGQLEAYRIAWLESFEEPTRVGDWTLWSHQRQRREPLLISDYHPLRRSCRMLIRLLEQRCTEADLGVVLELLPQSLPIPAGRALQDDRIRLHDGTPLRLHHRELLETLRARGAWIAGAWTSLSPHRRDHAAAAHWRRLRRAAPASRQAWFIGDWHLAPSHFPAELRRAGASPLVLHQSPEPLWDRIDSWPPPELMILPQGDWAWMHTPPLAHWASVLQDTSGREAEETASGLVESIAQAIADLHGFAEPGPVDCCTGARWEEFRSLLPAELSMLFAHRPPQHLLLHPTAPVAWTPGPMSPNQLVETAAHAVVVDQGNSAPQLSKQLPLRSFGLLWARALNPFLQFPDPAVLRKRYGIGTKVDGDAARQQAGQKFLVRENLAAWTALRLIADPELSVDGVGDLVRFGAESFFWRRVHSTIRASPKNAG